MVFFQYILEILYLVPVAEREREIQCKSKWHGGRYRVQSTHSMSTGYRYMYLDLDKCN